MAINPALQKYYQQQKAKAAVKKPAANKNNLPAGMMTSLTMGASAVDATPPPAAAAPTATVTATPPPAAATPVQETPPAQPGFSQLQPSTGMITAVKDWQDTPGQTVQGQLENVVRADSPIMQLARTEALQNANKRGLLNSSMAVGAAQDAVYRAALPIAQADAATAVRQAGYNVDTHNQADRFNAGQAFSRQERIANNDYDFARTQYTQGQENVRHEQSQIAGLAQSYQNSIDAINRDPNMTQQAKTYALSQLYDGFKANMSLISAIGEIDDVSVLLTPKATPKKPKGSYRNLNPQKPQAASGGKIICLRWHELGLMSDDLCALDQAYGARLMQTNPEWQKGYLRYAKHVVKRMHGETWQSRLFIKCLSPLVMPWAKQMGHIMGGDYAYNWFGACLMRAMVAFFVGMNRFRVARIKLRKWFKRVSYARD